MAFTVCEVPYQDNNGNDESTEPALMKLYFTVVHVWQRSDHEAMDRETNGRCDHAQHGAKAF